MRGGSPFAERWDTGVAPLEATCCMSVTHDALIPSSVSEGLLLCLSHLIHFPRLFFLSCSDSSCIYRTPVSFYNPSNLIIPMKLPNNLKTMVLSSSVLFSKSNRQFYHLFKCSILLICYNYKQHCYRKEKERERETAIYNNIINNFPSFFIELNIHRFLHRVCRINETCGSFSLSHECFLRRT